jgi:hypothetical protein
MIFGEANPIAHRTSNRGKCLTCSVRGDTVPPHWRHATFSSQRDGFP